MSETDRRSLLRGAAVTGAALPVLAACATTTPQAQVGSSPKRTSIAALFAAFRPSERAE